MTSIDDPTAGVTEAAVAAIWTELGLAVGSHDEDFFDLGGDSLILVRFLARVRERWGLDLPVDTIFKADFTVTSAARLIEQEQLASVDEAELAAALAELDGMSDEEVQALLEGGGAGTPGAGS